MRYIDLSKINPADPDVIAWERRASACLRELRQKPDHASRSTYLEEHGLWSSFKPILIRYFGEKCWYSDYNLEGPFGDVDHFRPKNLSVSTDGSVILEDGYWWLAYDYLNYRLSCEKCNRSFRDGGKKDYFPIKDGTCPARYGHPCEEEYLLIDPCNENDVNLIGYNEEGRVVPLTNDPWLQKRVKNSRWIYNLDLFNVARKKILRRCKNELMRFDLAYYTGSQDLVGAIEALFDLTSDDSSYSAVAKQYVAAKIEGKPYEDELKRMLGIIQVADNAVNSEDEPATTAVG